MIVNVFKTSHPDVDSVLLQTWESYGYSIYVITMLSLAWLKGTVITI